MSVKNRDKAVQDAFKRRLAYLQQEEYNKLCADCHARGGVTWASANLGLFLCIHCAGIHRRIGVHITTVRSVTLDLWTENQVAIMETVGNRNGAYIYENSLPQGFRRPTEKNGYELEQFIRAKYDRKAFFSSKAYHEVISGNGPNAKEESNDSDGSPSTSPEDVFSPTIMKKNIVADDIIFGTASAPPQIEFENSDSNSPFPFVSMQATRTGDSLFDLKNETQTNTTQNASGFNFIESDLKNQDFFSQPTPQQSTSGGDAFLHLFNSAPLQTMQPAYMASSMISSQPQNKGNYNVDLSDVYGRRAQMNNTVVRQNGYSIGGYQNRNMNNMNNMNMNMNRMNQNVYSGNSFL